MIVVGSRALEYFGLNRSTPKDIDIWYCDTPPQNRGGDIVKVPKEIYQLIDTVEGYATPDTIYTIKCSHLAWDIKWEKTKNDILWLKAKGCTLIPELYKLLKIHWEAEHGNKSFLSLNQSKCDFFNDNVTYLYEHDYLHELVSHPNPPVYKKVLKGDHDVLTDRSKFDILTFESQVRLFREEITVIACERWLINTYWQGKIGWYQAYMLSLKKVIVSLTKGWACDFIVCNLEYFIKPDYSYFKHLIKTLELKMSKVDTKEIEEFLKVLNENNELTDYSIVGLADGYLDEVETHLSNAELIGLGYEHIMQEGGGEGGSEYCEGVFRLNDRLYHVSWSYYSHNGYDQDGALCTLREVVPKEKTIIVYE